MATTTPNYGWPVPTSTDYVKDGALAIENLGDAIDATVFGLGGAGVTLISATTFSAQSTININSCFSSTYTNYRVLIDYKGDAGAVGFTVRLRIASDDTSAVYDRQAVYVTGTAVAGVRSQAQTSWLLTEGTRLYQTASIDFFSPNVNAPTRLIANYSNADTDWAFSLVNIATNEHRSNYQATGFTLLTTSAASGTIKVYGYKD